MGHIRCRHTAQFAVPDQLISSAQRATPRIFCQTLRGQSPTPGPFHTAILDHAFSPGGYTSDRFFHHSLPGLELSNIASALGTIWLPAVSHTGVKLHEHALALSTHNEIALTTRMQDYLLITAIQAVQERLELDIDRHDDPIQETAETRPVSSSDATISPSDRNQPTTPIPRISTETPRWHWLKRLTLGTEPALSVGIHGANSLTPGFFLLSY